MSGLGCSAAIKGLMLCQMASASPDCASAQRQYSQAQFEVSEDESGPRPNSDWDYKLLDRAYHVMLAECE